jgi:hypothetical protein
MSRAARHWLVCPPRTENAPLSWPQRRVLRLGVSSHSEVGYFHTPPPGTLHLVITLAGASPVRGVQVGPLTDSNALPSEQQAALDLFAGAIGLLRNVHSHRNVHLDATEAARRLIFASLLLEIIDSR